MCGIAGLIHRGKSSDVGNELQAMLQALKHRGPDSTGYALYADNNGENFIMRFKVGENVGEGSSSINEDESVYDKRKELVDDMLKNLGAKVLKEEKLTPYSYRYEIKYDDDLMDFSIMGASLYTSLYPEEKPNVALLNIGSEELKGNETIKETYQLLNEKKSDNYNFAGYIEGNHLMDGKVNVIVSDGFTGNVALKTAEGTANFITDEFFN